jgi:hypothetical protein
MKTRIVCLIGIILSTSYAAETDFAASKFAIVDLKEFPAVHDGELHLHIFGQDHNVSDSLGDLSILALLAAETAEDETEFRVLLQPSLVGWDIPDVRVLVIKRAGKVLFDGTICRGITRNYRLWTSQLPMVFRPDPETILMPGGSSSRMRSARYKADVL